MTIHFITGPMFSGKTKQLIRIGQTLSQGNVLFVKHTIDTRYRNDFICTHDKIQQKAISTTELTSLEISPDTKYILIDEGHFFSDLEIVEQWANEGKKIWISGLLSDSKRQIFPNIIPILAKLDHHS